MRKKIALCLVLIMLFSLFTPNVLYITPTNFALAAKIGLGTLSDVESEVYVKMGGRIKEAKGMKGMTLSQGDTIRTDKNSLATVTFINGSKVTLGPSTMITLTQAAPTRNSGGKITIKLKSGSIWNNIKSFINKEDEYVIETPTAVMGVKGTQGTQLLVSADPFSGNTRVSCMYGAVEVHYNTVINLGVQKSLLLMGYSMEIPSFTSPNPVSFPTPTPTPEIQSLGINEANAISLKDLGLYQGQTNHGELAQGTSPILSGIMAEDMVAHLGELLQGTDNMMMRFSDTHESALILGALQQSKNNLQYADQTQQFVDGLNKMLDIYDQMDPKQIVAYSYDGRILSQRIENLADRTRSMMEYVQAEARRTGQDPEEIRKALMNSINVYYHIIQIRNTQTATPPPDPYPANLIPVPNPPTEREEVRGPITNFRNTSIIDMTATFAWTQAINATRISLQYSEDGIIWEECTVDGTTLLPTATGATVLTLEPGKTYRFRLFVTGGLNEGASNVIMINLYEGAVVTNLLNEYGEYGSYGRYRELPVDFKFNGTMEEELYTVTVSGAAVEMALWYYDEDDQRCYFNLDGIPEHNDLVIGKDVTMEWVDDDYHWEAELEEAIGTAVNAGPSRDYFVELIIKEYIIDRYPDANIIKRIIVGRFTIE